MESIGLLAGIGRLPVELAVAARQAGFRVFAVALLDDVDKELEHVVEKFARINVAKLDEIITFFKKNDIKKVTMIGKVTKELLFNGQHEQLDTRMLKLLAGARDKSDDTLMLKFVGELAAEGIETLDQTILLKHFMPNEGILSARKPSEEEMEDIRLGFFMAKKLGDLDVGQTVVIKNKAVMALEAIEGTDACIKRGGVLAGKDGGAVVVKVAKPNQDNRFDVPVIGVNTIEVMIKVKAKVLAVEAGKTLIVDRQKVISLVNENDMIIAVI
ncbi:LpxI family protein [Pectinatus sottacetonis]|uniref:LpxI family protein n=1 Tax=Pectinatus sottacetonis TaxID=1002795 RepID=UPI0018C5AD54|nr:UDP-2,3-diacylglucosamine diphosphatase LpxI [Pectinatus sottacetonis]